MRWPADPFADRIEKVSLRLCAAVESRGQILLSRLHAFARKDREAKRLEAETGLVHHRQAIELESGKARDVLGIAGRHAVPISTFSTSPSTRKRLRLNLRAPTPSRQSGPHQIVHKLLRYLNDRILRHDRLKQLSQA